MVLSSPFADPDEDTEALANLINRASLSSPGVDEVNTQNRDPLLPDPEVLTEAAQQENGREEQEGVLESENKESKYKIVVLPRREDEVLCLGIKQGEATFCIDPKCTRRGNHRQSSNPFKLPPQRAIFIAKDASSAFKGPFYTLESIRQDELPALLRLSLTLENWVDILIALRRLNDEGPDDEAERNFYQNVENAVQTAMNMKKTPFEYGDHQQSIVQAKPIKGGDMEIQGKIEKATKMEVGVNFEDDAVTINQEESKNICKSEDKPGLWKLTGRKIKQYKLGKLALNGFRDGMEVTQRTVQSCVNETRKGLSLPKGKLIIKLAELKAFNPHDKIAGKVFVSLREPVHADSLIVTLLAVGRRNTHDKHISVFSKQICKIRGRRTYWMKEEFTFAFLVAKLEKDRSASFTFVRGVSDEVLGKNTAPLTWILQASLVRPGESWLSLRSAKYRIHVN